MTETLPVSFTFEGEPQYHLLGSWTRYSSWTARVTTVLEYFEIPYLATYIQLSTVKHRSRTGLVPVLIPLSPTLFPTPSKTEIQIHDSLSINEFLADQHPDLPLWPKDPILRALARSAAAEMHSGFSVVRSFDSNYVGKYTGPVPISAKARKEVERLLVLWDEARQITVERLGENAEGGYLFGEFGIVDAFFWPVLWRFRSYNLPLDTATPEALAWIGKMWSDPKLKVLGRDYFKQAEDPSTALPQYEDIFKGIPDVVYGRFEENWEFSADRS